MLRSPKDKFVKGPHRKAFEELVMNPAFEEATLAALLQLQTEMPAESTIEKGWDANSRMTGAKRYLEILTTLHIATEPPKKAEGQTLDWAAGV